MTEVAIKRLEKEDNGYYLFVEGGRIDHAHHDNQAIRALYEFVEFEKTINKDQCDIFRNWHRFIVKVVFQTPKHELSPMKRLWS